MSNEVSTERKSPEKLIKERIQAEFVSLIDDDMWDAMIQTALSDLRTPKYVGHDGRNQRIERSAIQDMIHKELVNRFQAEITKNLDAMLYGEINAEGKRVASEAVKKLVEEHSATMWAAMQQQAVESMVAGAMNQLRQAFANKGIYL